MSQSMQFPASGGRQNQPDDAQYKPYYGAGSVEHGKTGKTGEMPKNEHPSTFEDTIPPYSYPAQEPVTIEPLRQQQQQHDSYIRTSQRAAYQDGDAFENGYRPYQSRGYNSYMAQQVPPWARPQRQNGSGLRWLVFIVLGIALLQPILWVAVHILAALGILIGITIFALLLPIIFLLVIGGIIVLFVLGAFSMLGMGWHRYRRGLWW